MSEYLFGTENAGKGCLDVFIRIHTEGSSATGNWTDGPADQEGFISSVLATETDLQVYKDQNSQTEAAVSVGWSGADACWVEIGMIAAENSIIVNGGEKIATGKCTQYAISKLIAAAFKDIAVNAEKKLVMIPLLGTLVDVMFVKKADVAVASSGNAIGVSALQLDFDINDIGGGQSSMDYAMESETSIDDYKAFKKYKPISVTL